VDIPDGKEPIGLMDWKIQDESVLFEVADPDVPETDGIAVVLQGDGKSIRMRFIRGARLMGCGTNQLGVVMDHYVVMEYREPCRADQLAFVIESRPAEYNVKGLPFAGWAAGIDPGWVLGVKRSCHAIGVSFVVVAIEYLNLVDVH